MSELFEVFGIGPFLCVDDIVMSGAEHRGVKLDTHLTFTGRGPHFP